MYKYSLAFTVFIWCLLFTFPLMFYPYSSFLFYKICHHLPEKSFYLFGIKMEVCARCAGIYYGAFIGTILSFKFAVNTAKKWFLYSAFALNIADIVFYNLKFYNYSKILTLLIGLYSGTVVMLYFISFLDNYLTENDI